jgi:hypothetical protein
MEAQADIPPIIQSSRRLPAPVMFLGFVLLAIAIALLLGAVQITLPACSLKRMTGISCAFCGGTRSLQAIGHFHFAEAFWLNPLVTITALAAGPVAILSLLFPLQLARVKKLPLIAIALTLVALNWIFVIKFLPR